MGLLHKLRVLAGALVHKPFMPRQEKVDLNEGASAPAEEQLPRAAIHSDIGESVVTDGERVADLIARQQREEAD